ncbi:hypothetical protein [Bradyrhizobium sp. AUGA SZCCT0431]|uniref:hypothetical protein n=1 Tax=Bradyrhizobium sp. AUGA SZCCT0431 TaxID=2807674 RepID=UPI001BA9BFD1|nr:hypothetical protein [Bradyrhizobium sp. AUGA SZCCT0431]MBR1143682.1 hypothetical protein [Bradyrhizobium sp. AUGA SZCCT0431]
MKRAEDYAGGAVSLVIFATLAAIALTLTYQVLSWLKLGVWPGYSIAQMLTEFGIPRPTAAWIGVQQIIDGLLELHASVAMLAAGVVVSGGVFYVVLWLAQTLQRLFSPLPPRRP